MLLLLLLPWRVSLGGRQASLLLSRARHRAPRIPLLRRCCAAAAGAGAAAP
jgi:hypothetical protein